MFVIIFLQSGTNFMKCLLQFYFAIDEQSIRGKSELEQVQDNTTEEFDYNGAQFTLQEIRWDGRIDMHNALYAYHKNVGHQKNGITKIILRQCLVVY